MRVGAADRRAVRTGYLTPAGRYLRVVQSDADEADLLAAEVATRPPAGEGRTGSGPDVPVASGATDVDGTSWVTYVQGTREPIRIADVGGVRLLITGSGNDEDFRTLAAGTVGGEVLPR